MIHSPRRGAALALAFLLSAALLPGSAAAQLSPGKLSQAHAQLEGSTGCLQCHAPRKGVAAERCLECHGALAARIRQGEGLHAGEAYRSCETCHIEHHGREFELIYWGEAGRDAFDHGKTGWPLQGAHADAGCRDCHRPENLENAARLRQGGADPETTFLGLQTSCLGCHQDEHRGQLGTSCQDCHNQEAWKPAPGFDHDDTSFPLSKVHQTLACSACHPAETDPSPPPGDDGKFLQLSGLAHSTCANCHRDPHEGRFGNQCVDCHSPAGWGRVDRAGFDHSRTRFPLRGRHQNLSCTACHQGGATRTKLSFGSCSDCHRDPHQGRLGSSCASCHDPASWQKVDRGTFDHDRTRFPLRGEHAAVACSSCHTSGRETQDLRFGSCEDCHGDPHLGQLQRTAGGSSTGACADCHTVEGFLPSTFTVEDHQRSSFPLDGAHLAIPCVDCHLPVEPEALPGGLSMLSARRQAERSGQALKTVTRFRFSDTSCPACHGDPHDGQTASAGSCTACHSTASWAMTGSASGGTFDHAATGFPLDGGHARLACSACHGEGSSGSSAAAALPDFSTASSACASCHRDPHFGSEPPSAKARQPVSCALCHVTADWRRTSFDHARDAGFNLEGAHQRLTCADCHGSGRSPLPTTCEGCHGGPVISPSSGGS